MAVGTPGNDVVTLTQNAYFEDIDMGEGRDELTLADGGNIVATRNSEVVIGGAGNDDLYFSLPDTRYVQGNASVNLMGGTNGLIFVAPIEGLVAVRNVQTFLGSSGDDHIGFDIPVEGSGPVKVNMDAGFDRFWYNFDARGEASPITVSGAEVILGFTKQSVDITLGDRAVGTEVTMTGQGDVLRLTADDGPNTVVTHGVETIFGSDARDVVRIDAANYVIANLGAGNDRIEMMNEGPQTLEVTGVEALLGSKVDNLVYLNGDTPRDMSVDLGAGTNDIIIAMDSTSRSMLVSNTEQVVMGGGDDVLTIRTAIKNGTINMGDGDDTLYLRGSGNSLQANNAETIFGGAGVDKLDLSNSGTGSWVLAGDGADVIKGSDFADVLIGSTGADTLIGGGGADRIYGGWQKDVMTGGEGADLFIFDGMGDSDLVSRDIITDFQVGVDKLQFSGFLLSGEFSLTTEQVFSGFQATGNTQFHFVDPTDQLLIDMNGDAVMDMRMTLQGVDGSQLTKADIIWDAI